MYTTEGIKKTLFTSTLSTQEMVHSLCEQNSRTGKEEVVFTTKPTEHALLVGESSEMDLLKLGLTEQSTHYCVQCIVVNEKYTFLSNLSDLL